MLAVFVVVVLCVCVLEGGGGMVKNIASCITTFFVCNRLNLDH